MIVTSSIQTLRAEIRAWKKSGETIAFVPTMGNLHDGHLSLVKKAQASADRTVVSLFVNPLQFGPNEDFARYPRTVEEDKKKLSNINNNLLFIPNVTDLIEEPIDSNTKVLVPNLSDVLCGASRPGHFYGVSTIVAKLFNLVQPDSAIFGQKDYQQVLIIKKMTRDLQFPIKIIVTPTHREADGLAMSSRNQYLTPEQRKIAPILWQTLEMLKREIKENSCIFNKITDKYKEILEKNGFNVDYLEIRTKKDLQPPTDTSKELVILAAAFLGRTRLIDNVFIN
ncbi:MAG: pantoate-beta-alanine ligase [Gammaproteobacteria bacterium]|nr:pantoate-beta-alanine ligase [Gammaproteobacteria bacterium]